MSYSLQHLQSDTTTLAVGGIDGVLRILDQNAEEVLSSCVTAISTSSSSSKNRTRARLSEGTLIDRIPKNARPPIICLAVGMKKVVTTYNSKHITTNERRKVLSSVVCIGFCMYFIV
ncbi:hypothetical protein ACOSQ3_031890 [Xanthoceras sorbifolium]